MSLEKTDTYFIANHLNSPVVLTGPHNGFSLPGDYIKDGMPLGLDPYWFDPQSPERRHESCDWGMAPLFDAMMAKNKSFTMLGAHYSRLLVDLNRIPSLIIYQGSSENGRDIPGNMNLSEDEIQNRLDRFYKPYHNALDDILIKTKEKFGRVIWLDLHSFTPVWNGEPREVGVGTLKYEDTDFSKKAESILEKQFGPLFVPDQPYTLRISPTREISCALDVSGRHNIEYFGLEIRNDLLCTTQQVDAMSDAIIYLAKQLRDT